MKFKTYFLLILIISLNKACFLFSQQIIRKVKNYVLINIDESSGLKVGDEVSVLREDIFDGTIEIGKIKIVKYQAGACAGLIINEKTDYSISVNDILKMPKLNEASQKETVDLFKPAISTFKILRIYDKYALIDADETSNLSVGDAFPVKRELYSGFMDTIGHIKIIKYQNGQCAGKIISEKDDYNVAVNDFIVPFKIHSIWDLKEYYRLRKNIPAATKKNGRALTPLEQDPLHRSITAMRINEAPKLDGRLDDPVWQKAAFQGDFLQREPLEGVPTTEPTEIAILYDDENVYIGAKLFDSEPDKIVGTDMRRDGSFGNDDFFEMLLDTFHDKRNAYNLITNPVGLRFDAILNDEGKVLNSEWDGIWQSKTSIDEKGWYAEIAIPWYTLRFKDGDNRTWGAHFTRMIRRKNEDTFWRLVPLSAAPPDQGQMRMSLGGYITGFNGLKKGRNFEIKPFISYGLQNDTDIGNRTRDFADIGLDIKHKISSMFTADYTVNTDFAQVEADREQVNLTRFNLFFPEKREFFLENIGLYNFGISGRPGFQGGTSAIKLFHSRRIGIENKQQIPIIGGIRLNGKQGNTSIGLVSIQTKKSTFDDEEASPVPETNFSVLRLKQDIFSRSNIGIMILNKQRRGGGYNRSFGFDATINPNDFWSFFLIGAATYSPDGTDIPNGKRNNGAGHAGFDFYTGLVSFGGSFLTIEKSFNPEMGFIQRANIRKTTGYMSLSPKSTKFPSVRRFVFGVQGEYQTDMHNRKLNRDINGQFSIHFQNDSKFQVSVKNSFEYLEQDFEIRPGITIPYEEYNALTYQASYTTPKSRILSGSVKCNGGDFFTGRTFGGGLNATISAVSRVLAVFGYNYNDVDLAEGNFHTNAFFSRITVSITPDFFIKGFFQWLDDDLNLLGKDGLSGNVLIRYTYIPGSDFYLVFNQENLLGPGKDTVKNRTVLAKLTYLLR